MPVIETKPRKINFKFQSFFKLLLLFILKRIKFKINIIGYMWWPLRISQKSLSSHGGFAAAFKLLCDLPLRSLPKRLSSCSGQAKLNSSMNPCLIAYTLSSWFSFSPLVHFGSFPWLDPFPIPFLIGQVMKPCPWLPYIVPLSLGYPALSPSDLVEWRSSPGNQKDPISWLLLLCCPRWQMWLCYSGSLTKELITLHLRVHQRVNHSVPESACASRPDRNR